MFDPDTFDIGQSGARQERPDVLVGLLKDRVEDAMDADDAVAVLRQLFAVFRTSGMNEDALFYGSCLQMAYEGTTVAAAAFCLCIPFLHEKGLAGEIRSGCRVVIKRFPGTVWAATCRHALEVVGREATPRRAREAVARSVPAFF